METDWDTALDRLAARTRELLDEQGPSALGFYTTGQLFLEEYYTQAAIGHGALSCNHMDGNTRLCTATAAAAPSVTGRAAVVVGAGAGHPSPAAMNHKLDLVRVEHEVFHVARDIAMWSQNHVRDIAEAASAYDLDLDPMPSTGAPPVLSRLAQRTSTMLGRHPQPGLLLLADLRRLHRKAAGVSMDWELLGQAAQSLRKRDLLELSQRCHPQTPRQMRWANAMLKVVSPQVLSS